MKRVAWLTDIHLNFLGTLQIEAFLQDVLACQPDAVVISGDIGEAHSLGGYLRKIAGDLQKPVYYVLGNHDFYFGSIAHVRAGMETLSQDSPWLYWLPHSGIIELTPDTALVGHDGWADGRYGDYQASQMLLNDYFVIAEFAGLKKRARLERLNALGDEAADYFRRVLPQVFTRYRHAYVITHTPPFEQACLYKGKPSDARSLPHFACKAVGDALLEIMQERPNHQITVLCGHTHDEARAQILPNLLVLTGGTEYGAPGVQQLIEVG